MNPILVDNLPLSERLYGVKLYEQSSFVMPWHMHEFYELTLILDGRGTRIIGDNIDSFFPKDLLLLGPRLPHVWKNDSEEKDDSVARAITLQFTAIFPCPHLLAMPQMGRLATLLDQAKRGVLIRGKLQDQIEEKMKRLLEVDGARQLLLIIEILVDIAESGEYVLLASHSYTTSQIADTERWNRVNSFILENFSRLIRAEELARIAQLHPSSLGRYFKQTTGMSVTQYINQMRIAHACRLLAVATKPVVEICFDCGFQNLSHFNRCFRRLKEVTPSGYRQSLRRIQ